jgi:RHS repeat-associated protein
VSVSGNGLLAVSGAQVGSGPSVAIYSDVSNAGSFELAGSGKAELTGSADVPSMAVSLSGSSPLQISKGVLVAASVQANGSATVSVDQGQGAAPAATTSTVSYSYFSTGQRESITYPQAPAGGSATVNYSYDQAGAMASLTDWYAKTTTFSHDPDGNTTATAYPDGVDVSDSFDLAGAMTALTATASDASVAAGISYGLDSAEQVSSEAGSGALAGSVNYSYDIADRLGTVAKGTSTPASAAYDPAGNPTTLATGATQAFDRAGELTSATEPTGAKVAYTYNPSGDRTGATTTAPSGTTTTSAYGYSQADMMTTASVPGALPASYSYDATGLLSSVSSPAGVRADTWDMAAGLALLLTDATNDYLYGPTGTPVEQAGLVSNNVQYFVPDDQGSTRALFGASGSLDATFSYDAYGNLASSGGTATTPLLYDGQYLDPTTGLYYLRARWYDPATATFTSADPLVSQTGQPYAYAGDDPVNNGDPSGMATSGPPAPTPSATSYDYSFDLSTLASPKMVATFVHEDCYYIFPIQGCVDDFTKGEHMPLQEKIGPYTQSFPVEVETVGSTFFSFVALPGHPEGQGRRITFSFTQANSCQDVYLHVYTSKEGSAVTQWPGVRTIDFWLAHNTWSDFANNIRVIYPYWVQQGGPPKLA